MSVGNWLLFPVSTIESPNMNIAGTNCEFEFGKLNRKLISTAKRNKAILKIEYSYKSKEQKLAKSF